ncbi:MAG TPA: hypothetical protein VGX49_07480 [Jatrophihabitans sp.]|jgi:hypothetical protein|nr:hypothetical protein [Jatrophihabitans sp.]
MKTRQLATGLSALALVLTGCASGSDSGTATPAGAAMSMAPGQSMAGMSMAPVDSEPSEAAKMVCSDDIRDQVRTVLKLTAPAPVRSSWQDQLYTCTYTLPMGRMVLSVKQSGSKPAARDYFEALRTDLGSTEPLLGLGEQAYATRTGVAVVLKDDMTLRVDTTGLPAVFGPEQQRRTDLAYEIASDVLGCWTGHE